MKPILYTIIIAFSVGCNMMPKKQTSNLSGAYRLLSKNIKGNAVDSVVNEVDQLKFFTEDYFMYAARNTHNGVASFTIGSYKNDRRKTTEKVLFSASIRYNQF